MRRLILGLTLLLALLVAADVGARVFAEHRLSGQVRTALRLSAEPSVNLGGFPFLTHALSGHFPSVTVRDRSFTTHGWSISQATATLRDVRFDPRALLGGHRTTIRAASGAGSIGVGEGAVTTVLGRVAPGLSVTIASGRIRVAGAPLPAAVAVAIHVRGRALVVSAGSGAPLPSLTVPLPELLPGIRYTRAAVDGSLLVLDFVLDHPAVSI